MRFLSCDYIYIYMIGFVTETDMRDTVTQT